MSEETRNFIEEIITDDIKEGRTRQVVTRFPPEPNGYLHLGHAKSICLNFMTARKFGGYCNLRFDDTNPTKEDVEYIESIKRDIEWLGFAWKNECYGSDYFEYMYERACILVRKGLAYVCDLTPDEMREYRGTLTQPGKNSPYRNRSVEENLDLFMRMRAGEFADGEKVLRAKIDMASPNLNMRDPVIYRILRAHHHRTGDAWCIYPMYDFAHPLEDVAEGISHSICTMEFEDHRPLYNWFVENCDCENVPHQYEFARLNLTRTVMSKRYLKKLVDDGVVSGWDDPRMPTLSGVRRRGFPPEAVRDFCEAIGVAKAVSEVDTGLLEHFVRERLNATAPRVMCVLRPLKLTITNYEKEGETLMAEDLPGSGSTHEVPFSGSLYIEQEDFMEERPNKKYFRLCVGGEVRLKNAYIIKCTGVKKDDAGNVTEVLCEYDPESKSGGATADRKVKGTLHWADAKTAVPATVNVYGSLLTEEGELNPASLVVEHGWVEPHAAQAEEGHAFQFLRMGYYVLDSKADGLTFGRIVPLKDSFVKQMQKNG